MSENNDDYGEELDAIVQNTEKKIEKKAEPKKSFL